MCVLAITRKLFVRITFYIHQWTPLGPDMCLFDIPEIPRHFRPLKNIKYAIFFPRKFASLAGVLSSIIAITAIFSDFSLGQLCINKQ